MMFGSSLPQAVKVFVGGLMSYENTEEAIKNRQSRETGNTPVGYKTNKKC
jgi:hypothetical protein